MDQPFVYCKHVKWCLATNSKKIVENSSLFNTNVIKEWGVTLIICEVFV